MLNAAISLDDLRIPLANIHRPRGDNDLNAADIDISVRPVVYSLDLMFELMLALTSDGQNRRLRSDCER